MIFKAKSFYLFFLVTVFSVFLKFSFAAGSPNKKEELRIGLAAALTGMAQEWGIEEQRGAQLAIKDFLTEKKSKGEVFNYTVKLLVEDIKSTAKDTVLSVINLINIYKVDFLIGPTWLDSYKGALPILNKKGLLTIAPSGASTSIQESDGKESVPYPFIFSAWYNIEEEFKAFLKYLSEQKLLKLTLFFSDDPFWDAAGRILKDNASFYGIKIVSEVRVTGADLDFTPYLLSKIKGKDTDVIFVGLSTDKQAHIFLKQYLQYKIDLPLFSSEYVEKYVNDAAFRPLLRDYLYIITPATGDALIKFSSRYKKLYGSVPRFSASNTYDAVKILLQAVSHVGKDKAKVREYFLKNSFNTITFGKVQFNRLQGLYGGAFRIKRYMKSREFVTVRDEIRAQQSVL